jgi:centrosomal protein CEP19
MDEKFNKNQLKPGDPGFVYDKRIEFVAQSREDASWDEDDVNDYFDDDFV